jgi:hypothetical protein
MRLLACLLDGLGIVRLQHRLNSVPVMKSEEHNCIPVGGRFCCCFLQTSTNNNIIIALFRSTTASLDCYVSDVTALEKAIDIMIWLLVGQVRGVATAVTGSPIA